VNRKPVGCEQLLTAAEVAEIFRVGSRTVTRWAAEKKLAAVRTPGGHCRFRESDVRALLNGGAK
jgi:excisionase family DNA binding protein